MSEAGRVLALALALVAGVGAASAQSGLGDPTRPTALNEAPAREERAVQGPRWRLQSTLVAEARRLAVINGRTVAQGERIDGATLREVRREGVTLDVDGRSIELRVLPDAIDFRRSGR